MTVINSPATGFTGTSTVGPVTFLFKDGQAEHEGELPAGVAAYLTGQGFGIDSAPVTPEVPEPVDPRSMATSRIGAKLRDAAVDPKETDFLAPSNAGEANPHGPAVVSPEIHASEGVRPVRPGDVPKASKQEPNELGHASEVRDSGALSAVAGQPAGNASYEEWVAFAEADGQQPESLAEMTRNEIRDLYKNN